MEARTCAKTCKRAALLAYGRNSRQLMLGDIMSAVLCFERCRAIDFHILVQVRKACAYCLARNMYDAYRWIPSERNSADAPSRAFEADQMNTVGRSHDFAQARTAGPVCSLPACHGTEKTARPEGRREDSCQTVPNSSASEGAGAEDLSRQGG